MRKTGQRENGYNQRKLVFLAKFNILGVNFNNFGQKLPETIYVNLFLRIWTYSPKSSSEKYKKSVIRKKFLAFKISCIQDVHYKLSLILEALLVKLLNY